MGDDRAEGPSEIGDEGQVAVSCIPDVHGMQNLSPPLRAGRLVLKLLGAALTEVGAREAVVGAEGRQTYGSICSSEMWVRTASCLLVWRLQGVEHTAPPFPGTFQQTQVNFRGKKRQIIPWDGG